MVSSENFDQLKNLLASLGTPALASHFGANRCEILESLGADIISSTLAEAVALQEGAGVFKTPSIRRSLLDRVNEDRLRSFYQFDHLNENVLDAINGFSWGNNAKTKTFLNLVELSDDVLDEDDESSENEVESVTPPSLLHPYQNWIRKDLFRFLMGSENTRALVHMPTGSGKTRTCMEALCDSIRNTRRAGFTVVWMAHSEELCEQAVQTFEAQWRKLGSTSVNLIRLWGGRQVQEFDEAAVNFVVTSFQTAYSMTRSPSADRFQLFSAIKRSCEFLVVDEAHQSTAPTYQEAIELFSNNSTKLVGLTATPGRSRVGEDGSATEELAAFYNQNKINIVGNDGRPLENPIRFLQQQQILSEIDHKIWGGTDIELTDSERRIIEDSLDVPKSVLDRVALDHERTARIVTNTMAIAVQEKKQTILFAPSKENAVDIALVLKLRGCAARAVTSDTSPSERRRYIEQFKSGEIRVLTNFGVLTTGFDAPNTEAVVIARPTNSVVLYSQMIGRGLRGVNMGGTPECLIVDVNDNIVNLPNVHDAFMHFDEFYLGG